MKFNTYKLFYKYNLLFNIALSQINHQNKPFIPNSKGADLLVDANARKITNANDVSVTIYEKKIRQTNRHTER